MNIFEFLTRNPHFKEVITLDNHPVFEGDCYQFVEKSYTRKPYPYRLGILIQSDKKSVTIVKEEVVGYESEYGLPIYGEMKPINDKLQETPQWFQTLVKHAHDLLQEYSPENGEKKLFLVTRNDAVGLEEHDGLLLRANSKEMAGKIAVINGIGMTNENIVVKELQSFGEEEILFEATYDIP